MPIDRPFKKQPDFEHFRKVLLRETTEGPIPIVESIQSRVHTKRGLTSARPSPQDADVLGR